MEEQQAPDHNEDDEKRNRVERRCLASAPMQQREQCPCHAARWAISARKPLHRTERHARKRRQESHRSEAADENGRLDGAKRPWAQLGKNSHSPTGCPDRNFLATRYASIPISGHVTTAANPAVA